MRKEGPSLYLMPKEAELIACLINKAINDSISLTNGEEEIGRIVADYFGGIKAYARITAERM